MKGILELQLEMELTKQGIDVKFYDEAQSNVLPFHEIRLICSLSLLSEGIVCITKFKHFHGDRFG